MKQKLHDLDGPDLCCGACLDLLQSAFVAVDVFGLPFGPGPLAMTRLENAK
jgi:hypothetical protein